MIIDAVAGSFANGMHALRAVVLVDCLLILIPALRQIIPPQIVSALLMTAACSKRLSLSVYMSDGHFRVDRAVFIWTKRYRKTSRLERKVWPVHISPSSEQKNQFRNKYIFTNLCCKDVRDKGQENWQLSANGPCVSRPNPLLAGSKYFLPSDWIEEIFFLRRCPKWVGIKMMQRKIYVSKIKYPMFAPNWLSFNDR